MLRPCEPLLRRRRHLWWRSRLALRTRRLVGEGEGVEEEGLAVGAGEGTLCLEDLW